MAAFKRDEWYVMPWSESCPKDAAHDRPKYLCPPIINDVYIHKELMTVEIKNNGSYVFADVLKDVVCQKVDFAYVLSLARHQRTVPAVNYITPPRIIGVYPKHGLSVMELPREAAALSVRVIMTTMRAVAIGKGPHHILYRSVEDLEQDAKVFVEHGFTVKQTGFFDPQDICEVAVKMSGGKIRGLWNLLSFFKIKDDGVGNKRMRTWSVERRVKARTDDEREEG